jgi:nitric oxide reductase NorQ protein
MPTGSADEPLAAFRLTAEPRYVAGGGEVAAFEAAHARRLPVLLKGPTGCGKTRFVEHMAWRLGRPLVTVACHDDLSAADLLGRWLLDADGTRWQDGPLTLAARHGAICYLDELAEARPDVTVLLHPLSDTRRLLPLAACNTALPVHRDFHLVASYNPGYQGLHKALKPSTRQRFVAFDLDVPAPDVEARIVAQESGAALTVAQQLVALAVRTRRLQDEGLDAGASTRLLVHAALLVQGGLDLKTACRQAVLAPLTDDAELRAGLQALLDASLG